MDNILLNIKKDLLEELKNKNAKKAAQDERIVYINNVINEIEKKFFELMKFKIQFSDFKNFIGSLDTSIIFSSNSNRLFGLLNNISDNSVSSDDVEKIYIELSRFVNVLKRLQNSKEKYNLRMEEEIDNIREVVDKIDDKGDLVSPVDVKFIEKLISLKKYFYQEYFSGDSVNYFYREITIKNNAAIKRYNTLRNARRIQENRKGNTSSSNKAVKTPSLDKAHQLIYDKAKKIVSENSQFIGNLTDIEKDYLDELNDITDSGEIKTCIELMSDSESSLRLIINSLNDKINKITSNNDKQFFSLIGEYIKLYEIFAEKYQKECLENEKKRKIQEKDEKHLFELEELFGQINESIKEDKEALFDKLDDNQVKNLSSFSDITDDIDIELVDKTLSKSGLNFNFLLLYNNFMKINEYIDEYYELNELLEINDKINRLERIAELYEKYNRIKRNFVDEKNLEKDDNESVNEKNNGNNILIYLVDDSEITYVERQVESQDQFLDVDYTNLLSLISDVKSLDPNVIHLGSEKVKPKSGYRYTDYKKRRLSRSNQRLIYIPLSKKVLKTDRPVYLVITGGTKTESKNAPVYSLANNLQNKVLDFIRKFNSLNMTEEEIQAYLDSQRKIEEHLLDSIKPKNLTRGGIQNGK